LISVLNTNVNTAKQHNKSSTIKDFAKKMWHSRWTADISLLLVALIWGTTYAAAKDVVTTVPVMQFLFIRFAITVLLMIPFTYRSLRTADRLTWINGAIFGLFLLTIFTLETFGVAFTTASNAGFIISLCVVLVPFVDALVYRKSPKVSLLGAVFLSMIGTALLTLKDGYQFNMGDLLILGAAVCRAVQMSITKKLTEGKEFNSGALTTIQLSVVAIGSGSISFFQHPTSSIHFSSSFWIVTAYLAVFATIFAFYIQLVMIRRTSPSRVALLLSSEPLFAALFAILLMGEHLSVLSIIGGMLIMTGMLLGKKLQM
jgi:drug/metabolite transporter (DMT)-like permease